MRYLVKARVKPEKSRALVRAIDKQTLGRGSIAGDEYLHNMNEARINESAVATWVETCFYDTPLAEERPYWEEYFQVFRVKDAHFTAQLPARERHRTVGLLRLRLHEKARRETSGRGQFISGRAAFKEGRSRDRPGGWKPPFLEYRAQL